MNSNTKILFRIPFTLYWIAFDTLYREFLIVTKQFDHITGLYNWHMIT